MKCLNPIQLHGQYYNCGKCINCRINYTSSWSLRLIYEISTNPKASFITLTYNNENLPKDNGLHVEDLQDFWKRLRINLKREYHEFTPKIKYYACGEYGDKEKIYLSPGAKKLHGRPHYHAIVFGLDDLNDKHREILKKSWTFCEPWFFDKNRGRNSGMQEVTPDDINYVTGYVQKKINGELAKEYYGECQSPFSVCSNGLGLDFALQNKERLISNGFTFFKGHKVSVPRYFCEKFGVKKSDLINFEPLNQEKQNKILQSLEDQFMEDMQRKGIYLDKKHVENIEMYNRRFIVWLENRQFDMAKYAFEEYRKRRQLYGEKI